MRASADRMMPPLLWLPSVAILSRAEFRSERKVALRLGLAVETCCKGHYSTRVVVIQCRYVAAETRTDLLQICNAGPRLRSGLKYWA